MAVALYKLIDEIEKAGFNWLVRNDDEQGYFANVTTKDFQGAFIRVGDSVRSAVGKGQRAPAYAPTIELALKIAFDYAKRGGQND